MLKFLSQLDSFGSYNAIRVIASTKPPDVLNPGLLRSGPLDWKIKLPHQAKEVRVKALCIHPGKVWLTKEVLYKELRMKLFHRMK